PVGRVNGGIGGNVGPTRLGSNALADKDSSGFNPFE
ncbi:glutamine synthetase family protein, partial [Bacillus cereus]